LGHDRAERGRSPVAVGLTNIISGSALSGLVLAFMRSESRTGATAMR